MAVSTIDKVTYSNEFYAEQRGASQDSADCMVPFLFDTFRPASVLDVGCGVGTWVRAFEHAGCTNAHGMDGPWASTNELSIRPEQFTAFDFSNAPTPFTPLLPQKRYDLVTSFEFAEHILPEFADPLVDMLTSLSDAVVLGAAIPLQGGTYHVNEQWPAYWRAKFAARGFVACDVIRPALWDDLRIRPWYRQNTIAYFRDTVPERIALQAAAAWQAWANEPRSFASPEMWVTRSAEALPRLDNLTRIADRLARNFVKKVIGRK